MAESNKADAKKNTPKKNYLRYGSLGYEMAALMIAAVLIGKYLDNHFGNEKKIITAILVIVFMGAFMFKLFRDLTNDNKSDK